MSNRYYLVPVEKYKNIEHLCHQFKQDEIGQTGGFKTEKNIQDKQVEPRISSIAPPGVPEPNKSVRIISKDSDWKSQWTQI